MKSHPSNLDLTKPVQTRDGRPVRILCTDRKGDFPVIALVGLSEGLAAFKASGYTPAGLDTCLVNVPETVRVCFYRSYGEICSQVLREGWTEAKMKKDFDVICFKDIEFA